MGALAWGCSDVTNHWNGGSVYRLETVVVKPFVRYASTECHVTASEGSAAVSAGLIASNLVNTANPIFNGGGFAATNTLAQCQQLCRDTNGCDAIEWSDQGSTFSDSTTKLCALAWGCSDVTNHWNGGSVYRME